MQASIVPSGEEHPLYIHASASVLMHSLPSRTNWHEADVARAAVPVVAAALPPAAAAAVVLADVLVTAVAMWCRCLGCKGCPLQVCEVL